MAKIKATEKEIRQLKRGFQSSGEEALTALREKSTQHLADLIQCATEHKADELLDFLRQQEAEHEQLNARLAQLQTDLAQLQTDRIAAINKRLATVRKTEENLLKEREALLKEELERDLDPEIEDWLKRVKDGLPNKCTDLTVFLTSEDCFGIVVHEKGFISTFGREGNCDNIHFILRPEHIKVYKQFSYIKDELTDCYQAVVRAFDSDIHFTPSYDDSLFIAFNWDIKPERHGDVDWGDYGFDLKRDWPKMKERALTGPWSEPQLAVILKRLWSFVGGGKEDTDPPKKKKARTINKKKRRIFPSVVVHRRPSKPFFS